MVTGIWKTPQIPDSRLLFTPTPVIGFLESVGKCAEIKKILSTVNDTFEDKMLLTFCPQVLLVDSISYFLFFVLKSSFSHLFLRGLISICLEKSTIYPWQNDECQISFIRFFSRFLLYFFYYKCGGSNEQRNITY